MEAKATEAEIEDRIRIALEANQRAGQFSDGPGLRLTARSTRSELAQWASWYDADKEYAEESLSYMWATVSEMLQS